MTVSCSVQKNLSNLTGLPTAAKDILHTFTIFFLLMPSLPSDLSCCVYSKASHLPNSVWKALRMEARSANVILPRMLKALVNESAGIQDDPIWITIHSGSHLEFILFVTEGVYPTLYHDAVQPVTELFVQEWSQLTGIEAEVIPYYTANITYCTAGMLTHGDSSFQQCGATLRPATPADVDVVAKLCFIFAKYSPPFSLTTERSILEASILIRNKQVWVHTAHHLEEIASIVAYTRNSETIGTITKVITDPVWRGQGCAERLVRRVCKHLFDTEKKESVVLYVGHNNPAARIYARIGFAGLTGEPAVGIDPWLEIGFDRREVTLGHW